MGNLKIERLVVNDFMEASRKSVDVIGVVKARDLYESIKDDEKTKEWSNLAGDTNFSYQLPVITQYNSDVIYDKENRSIILNSPVLVTGKNKVKNIYDYNPDDEIVVNICLDTSLSYLYDTFFDIKGESQLDYLGFVKGLSEDYGYYNLKAKIIANCLGNPLGIPKISLITVNKTFVERTHKVAGEVVQAVSWEELKAYIINVYKDMGEDYEKTIKHIKEVIEKNSSEGIYNIIKETI